MGLATLGSGHPRVCAPRPHRRPQTLWHPEPGCPRSDLCPPLFPSLRSPRNGDKITPDSPRAWTACFRSKPVGAGVTSVNTSTSQRGKLRLREGRAWPDHLAHGCLPGENGTSGGQPRRPELFKFCRFTVSGLPSRASVSPVLQLREGSKNSSNSFLRLFFLLMLVYICGCTVAQSCPTLCDPMDCSTPGFPVHHHLPEFAQTHVH